MSQLHTKQLLVDLQQHLIVRRLVKDSMPQWRVGCLGGLLVLDHRVNN